MAAGDAEGTLRTVTARFVAAFPGRIRSIHVEGSGADGTALATSDLDVEIVFRDAWRDGEREAAGGGR